MPWMEHLQSADWAAAGRTGLAAYLLGCFTTGYYLVRGRTGQDIRQLGSGSVGARNVGRLLGWRGFWVTVLGDLGKGALAVCATRGLTHDEFLVALAMLAVVAGHLWPFQLKLRGGKGMATSLGALCFYDFRLALAFGLIFLAGLVLFRRTLLPGLFAFGCLPPVAAFLGHDGLRLGYDPVKVISIWLLTSAVLIAHRKNLIDQLARFWERHQFRVRNHPPEL